MGWGVPSVFLRKAPNHRSEKHRSSTWGVDQGVQSSVLFFWVVFFCCCWGHTWRCLGRLLLAGVSLPWVLGWGRCILGMEPEPPPCQAYAQPVGLSPQSNVRVTTPWAALKVEELRSRESKGWPKATPHICAKESGVCSQYMVVPMRLWGSLGPLLAEHGSLWAVLGSPANRRPRTPL